MLVRIDVTRFNVYKAGTLALMNIGPRWSPVCDERKNGIDNLLGGVGDATQSFGDTLNETPR